MSPAQRLIKLDTTGLAIFPGELPTYTGWERPANTLAPYFKLRADRSIINVSQLTAGNVHTIVLQCIGANVDECRTGGSILQARWVGPAVLVGHVVDQGDGSYRLSARLYDPGTYFVEVWLAFSRIPHPGTALADLPGFEGY